jgi:hypothetical protein
MRSAYRILSENLKGRDHLGSSGVNRTIILKWTVEKKFTPKT